MSSQGVGMPHTAASIVAVLDLADIGSDLFLGHPPAGTRLAKAYGGQLFAQAFVAASRTVADDREAHSASAQFLAAGTPREDVRYEVERVRDGRSFSTRYLRAHQGDREVLRLSASFHVPEPGLRHALEIAKVPAPDELPTLHEAMGEHSSLPAEVWRDEWSGIEVRYAVANLSGEPPRCDSGSTVGRQQQWMRVRQPLPDSPMLHRQVIAYLSDHTFLAAGLVPHGFMLGDPELPRATLSHSIWFHSHARADEWLLIDQRSPWADGALGLSFATIHTRDGRLVASLAQEGLLRPHGDLRRRLGLESS